MATYEELYSLTNNSELRNKIEVAVAVKAQGLIDGQTPTAAEIAWASGAIDSPRSMAESLLVYVLAANKDATLPAILSASDSAIQGNVDAAVDTLIAGGS